MYRLVLLIRNRILRSHTTTKRHLALILLLNFSLTAISSASPQAVIAEYSLPEIFTDGVHSTLILVEEKSETSAALAAGVAISLPNTGTGQLLLTTYHSLPVDHTFYVTNIDRLDFAYARVVYFNPLIDLALVKYWPESEHLQEVRTVNFASEKSLAIGQRVLAIGNSAEWTTLLHPE